MTNFRILRLVLPVTGIFLCSSCTTIGELPHIADLQSKIENLKQPIQLPSHVDVEHFATYMAPLSAKFKPGFLALTDKLHEQPRGQFLSGQLTALDESILLNNSQNMREYLDLLVTKLVYEARIPSATDPQGLIIKDKIESIVKNLHQKASPAKQDLKEVSKRNEVYLKAYFKKSTSQLARLAPLDKSEKSTLQAKVAGVLNRNPAIAKVMDELAPQLQKIGNKITNSSTGFISRDGIAYTFPGVTGQGAQTNVDHSQIEADVIRIILEALRDTYAPLSVLSTSTAASAGNADILDFGTDQSDQIIVNWHIDHRDSSNTLQFTLTADQFQDIEAKARSTESSVAGAVGKAIRGGSWGALNNEAVARSLETAAGVLARHTAERAEWCVQAQRGKVNPAQPKTQLKSEIDPIQYAIAILGTGGEIRNIIAEAFISTVST